MSKRKRALITGITGQDGSYLAEFLLGKNYEVYGLIRRSSSFNRISKTIKPDEVYNLGAQSHVKVSFEIPEYTTEITAVGTTRLLEAIRDSGIVTKYYQASSSEMFGNTTEFPQNEKTPFYPRSPYAAAKVYAYWMTVNYRESYGIFA